jgi:predicted PurR-regulated permease PerM
MPDMIRRTTARSLVFLALLVLTVAILKLASYILIPLALSILFSFLLGPLVRMLQRAGLDRVLAVVAVSLVAFLLFAGVFWGIGAQVVELAKELPKYQENFFQKVAALPGARHVVGGFPEFQPGHEGTLADDPKSRPVPVVQHGNIWAALWVVVGTAQEIIRLIASTALVVLLTMVMLIYKEEIRDRFIRLTGASRLTVTTKALDEAAKRISDYMFRKFLVNAICGVAVTLGLLVLELFGLGVPFGFLWGFLLAVLRIIPGLGFWLALLPPALLSLVGQPDWESFLLVVGIFLVTEVFAANVLEPRFYGRQIGLLPVATLVSLTFWTWVWGPVGLLLAIPITLCLAVLGKYVPALGFLSVLLSDQPAMDPKLRYYQRLIANDRDEATEIVEDYLQGEAAPLVYDDVLLPALSHAKRDVSTNQLTPLDQKFVCDSTREILENVCEVAVPQEVTEDSKAFARIKLLGVPAGDETDELALIMVDHHLRARGYHMQVGIPGRLSAEVVDWVDSENPPVVCVLSVAPGELTQSRFICKRLRARFADIKLVAARLGVADDLEAEKEILIKAGADQVCMTVAETGKELIQVLQQVALQIPLVKPTTEPAGAPV